MQDDKLWKAAGNESNAWVQVCFRNLRMFIAALYFIPEKGNCVEELTFEFDDGSLQKSEIA